MNTFSILGRTLQVNGVAAGPLLDWIRARWQQQHPLEPVAFEINVDVLEQAPEALPTSPPDDQLELTSATVALHDRDPVFWLGDSQAGSRLEFHPTKTMISLWGSGSMCHELLHLGISEALRASGLVPLHASVAARDGQATLFLGPSGRGKTTTLMRALEAGHVPVAEDVAYVDPETLLVYSFDQGLRLLPDTALEFQRIFGIQATRRQDDKFLMPFSEFGQPLQPAQLTRVAVLERSPQHPTCWEPLPAREATLALWSATGVSLSRAARTQTSTHLFKLVSTLERTRLVLGQGPIPF